MLMKAFTVGVAALLWAVPAAGQQRGTVEFGAFASTASFDNNLSLQTGYGGGGRVGMFLDPRWSIEFEDILMRATRPNGLTNANVGVLSGRLVATPVKAGALSLLLGAGAGVSTETHFLHSYGVDALVGGKLALGDNIALRVDGVWDWLANEKWKTYKSVRAGFVMYRHPNQSVRTLTVSTPSPVPTMMPRMDSVSAAETRRLRDREADLRALRDSLNRYPPRTPVWSPAVTTTMEARIHFAFDKSELTDSATRILDEKVEVFRANPTMAISIMGYTDVTGTDAYNMALGTRRAQAAKDYIVSRGIVSNRITIESKGERQQIANSAGVDGEAPNRRAIFQLVIAPDSKP